MMMIKNLGFAVLTLCFSFQLAFSQKKAADVYYENSDYKSAANLYEKVINKGKEDNMLEVIERAAYCFKMVNNYEKAEKFYGMAVLLDGVDPESYLNLGQLLKNNSKIKLAKVQFENYLKIKPNSSLGQVMLESCDLITKWASQPTQYQYHSVEGINTSSSELAPFPYGEKLAFSSDKNYLEKDKKDVPIPEYDGMAYSIFIYDVNNEKEPIQSLSKSINSTKNSEGPAFFTTDLKKMFYIKVLKKTSQSVNQQEIWAASLANGKWQRNDTLSHVQKDYSFNNPVISKDNSVLYFSSDKMPGGEGKFDIYYCKISKNKLGRPINIGNVINTEGSEAPCYIDENNELYFSSNQHPGFGGMDIFSSKKKGDTWTKPENLKLPFNSTKDDLYYFPVDDKSGYFASNRDGGKGKDDIYAYSKHPFSEEGYYSNVEGVYKIGETPLTNKSLTLLDEHEQLVQTAVTDENGAFKFNNVATGNTYHILVDEKAEDIIDEANIYLTSDDEEKKALIDRLQKGLFKFNILKSDDAEDMSLFSEFDADGLPTIVIMGQLSSTDKSKNLNKRKVFVIDSDGNTITSTFTDRLGQFKFEKLSMDEEYLFKLEEEDFNINIEIINKEGVLIGKTMKNKGGMYVYHKFTINPSANPDIRGVYKYGTLPADGVTLYLIDENDAMVQFATTGVNGEFEFTNLHAGHTYHIKPESTDNIPVNSNLYLLDTHTGLMMPVSKLANGSFKFETLAPLPAEELELMAEEDYVIQPRIHLMGWINNTKDKTYPANLTVEIVDIDGNVIAIAKTNERGEFRFFNLPMDEEYLFNIPEDDPYYEIKILGSDDSVIGFAKRNENNQYVYHKFTINPSKNPDIRGLFKYGNLPADKVTLNLIDEEDNIIMFTTTNQLGEFAFNALSPGKEYRIEVDKSSGIVPENANMLVYDDLTGLMLPVSRLANGRFKFETLSPLAVDDIDLMDEEDISEARFNFFAHIFSKLPMDIPEGLEVFILDDQGNVIATARTDRFGKFNYTQLPFQEEYILKISEDDPNFELKVVDDNGALLGVIKRESDGTFVYNPKELERNKVKVETKPAPNSTYKISSDLLFEFNSSALNNASITELNKIAEFLKNTPSSNIEVNSHTDSKGTDKYNMWLSERRSNSIKDYLIQQGISTSRITAKHYGESKLLNECADGVECPPEKHAENRRTEVRFYD